MTITPFASFDDAVIWQARRFLFVREAGANHGARVEAIQHWCGGQPGESWCCYFATMILDLMYLGAAPIPRLGACQDVLNLAVKQGWVVATPVPGDLFILVNDDGHAHHIGFVTNATDGLSGNTSADGMSSNGDGVHEHARNYLPQHVKYVHYPRPT
jgi:hypothetical protein